MYSPSQIKKIITDNKFIIKRSFGQNFLVNKVFRDRIISACHFDKTDDVVEIGAGLGALTEAVLPEVKNLTAVEKDKGLAAFLKKKFEVYKNLSVINDDILNYDIASLRGSCYPLSFSSPIQLFEDKLQLESRNSLKIIGNLPYYITSPIIFHLLSFKTYIDSIYITVQKEVAQRAAASPGTKNYGLLSCSVQYHADVSLEFKIPKSVFYPVPKVDSAFLKLNILKVPCVKVRDEELLFKIIRAAFQFRRKKLLNAMLQSADLSAKRDKLEAIFEKLSLDKNTRGETLSLAQFAALADAF